MEDQAHLQTVINKLKEWCDNWLVSINVNKCKCNHVSYGEKDNLGTDYYISTNNIKYVIQKVNHIKDLGVTFDIHLCRENK